MLTEKETLERLMLIQAEMKKNNELLAEIRDLLKAIVPQENQTK